MKYIWLSATKSAIFVAKEGFFGESATNRGFFVAGAFEVSNERAWQWFRYMIVKLAPKYKKITDFRTSLAKKSMFRCQARRKKHWVA